MSTEVGGYNKTFWRKYGEAAAKELIWARSKRSN